MLKPPNENLRQRAKHPVSSRSRWDDVVWNWDGGNPATPKSLQAMRWDFAMTDGTRFTEPQWSPWAEAMKIAVWSLVADPPADRKSLRIGTLARVYRHMRLLVRWMHDNGYERLNQLTGRGQREFIRYMRCRKGRRKNEKQVNNATLSQYQNTLETLFLQGKRYPQIAIEEPAPQDAIRLSMTGDITPLPRTPEAVATALIAGAIRLLGPPAEDIIEARNRVFELYRRAHDKGIGSNRSIYVRKRLKAKPLAWRSSRNESWYAEIRHDVHEVRGLTNRVCDAAFVVLMYLVGMRVSEILALEPGCITKRSSLAGDETFTFITGAIYKTAPTAQGQAHEWVAPPIVERAIEVLERISRPLREQSGKRSLWLTYGRGVHMGRDRISVLTLDTIGKRLNEKFAPFIGVPAHEGTPWHLSTHQGRKTFAYLVAKQDRSGLHALKEHLGHRSIVMTDRAYSGHDHEMTSLIGEAGMQEMVYAFAEVLTATELAGKGGEIIVNRSPFRGQVNSDDVLEYARQRLLDTGLRFEICDYGYCYYNVRHAACQGDDHGPNLALRTQSVCVGCKNFVVAPKHLPVWKDRKHKYEVVLEHTEMAPEAASAARAKVVECEEVIQSLEQQQAAQ